MIRICLAAVLVTAIASPANAEPIPVPVFTPSLVGQGGTFTARSKVEATVTGVPRTEDGEPSLRPSPGKFLKVIDPGERSPLDFTIGDTLSIEAWVRIEDHPSEAFPYIVGKGRTHTNASSSRDANQNYSLRLTGTGKSTLSFLWMDTSGTNVSQSAHRWTSKAAVPIDGRWHHVALSYTFGTAEEPIAYIDGKPTDGVWDMRGNSAKTPVTDNDDLWIGASMGGGHLFPGLIDGLAIYRGALPKDLIAERTKWVDTQVPELPWSPESLSINPGETAVSISDLPARGWFGKPSFSEPVFQTDGMAITRLPNRYSTRGIITDRGSASMVRMATEVQLPPGKHRILLRTLDAARVYVGDKLVVERKSKSKLNGSAHNKVYALPEPPAGVVQAPAAHDDVVAEFESTGGTVRVEAYRLLGGEGRVPQLGEFLVAIAAEGKPFQVVGSDWQPSDGNWQALLDRENELVRSWNKAARTAVTPDTDAYWEQRHVAAAAAAGPPVELPAVENLGQAFNNVDYFIQSGLESEELKPMPLLSDDAFLRRVTLDLTGRIPTREELRQLGRDRENPPPLDRSAVIDTLLAKEEWADHWTSYWMDVLAENPALTKPTLNNSGPFRWYIHDALTDNWGMDRFVTELIRMGGSRYGGGPSGFAMASQNDVPMAAKAHILGTAFLGLEMKCARCHDAPGHPFQQSDLFSVAAMLNRKPLKVPASSSIPATPEELAEMVVTVSIKPGESIKPVWPFTDLSDSATSVGDSREQLAHAITDPSNMRFREVLANRLWTRLMGAGLFESTEDWSDSTASHPKLLKYLARELLISGDDMKHLARLICNSAVYQREAVPGVGRSSFDANQFRGPVRRRLTAEQLVDSLHVAVGKPMRGEIQSFSADGVQGRDKFLEMGRPSRAWQLICTSAERDRQSLALPEVDSLNELLQAYGWRPQRQEPTDRVDNTPTPLTPMMLANGSTASRLLDATSDAWLTHASVEAESATSLLNNITLAVLGRRATSDEHDRFLPLLAEGFDNRLTGDADSEQSLYRHRVSWRNHFDPEAERLILDRWSEIEGGDGPTKRLTEAWRQRAEDVMWVLVNSPEFSWTP